MTLQMALLESKMEGEERGIQLGRTQERENVAIKLIRMGLKFADIQKATDLPIHRLEQLAKDNRDN